VVVIKTPGGSSYTGLKPTSIIAGIHNLKSSFSLQCAHRKSERSFHEEIASLSRQPGTA
jgi:hypothetical protein